MKFTLFIIAYVVVRFVIDPLLGYDDLISQHYTVGVIHNILILMVGLGAGIGIARGK